MSEPAPPFPDPDPEPQAGRENAFDRFIHQDLDTSGLTQTPKKPLIPRFGLEGGEPRFLSRPAGDVLDGPEPETVFQIRIPEFRPPLYLRSGWNHRVMLSLPDTLYIEEARIGHGTEIRDTLILPMNQFSSRRIRVIPEDKPGMTAICYRASHRQTAYKQTAALSERPNAGENVAGQTIWGLVRNADLPPLRTERASEAFLRSVDWGQVLDGVLLVALAAALLLAVASQIELGSQREHITALQAQVQALETLTASSAIPALP